MRRFLSSTFSSSWRSLLDRDGSVAGRVIVVACLLVAAAELAARSAFQPIGTAWEYWDRDAAVKYLWYARTADGDGLVPEILVVGDSTGARNLVPQAIEETLSADLEVYNLAWPANFPAAFAQTTLPAIEKGRNVPRLVLVSMSPVGFRDTARTRRLEAGIMSCAYCRRQQTGHLIEDYVWLTRTREALSWRELWFSSGIPEPPPRKGFMPLDSVEPETIDDTASGTELPLSDDRMRVLDDLYDLALRRGFHLVLIVPPRRDRLGDPEFVRRIRRLSREVCTVVDASGAVGDPRDFFDVNHLNRAGAEKFSRWLAEEHLSQLLAIQYAASEQVGTSANARQDQSLGNGREFPRVWLGVND